MLNQIEVEAVATRCIEVAREFWVIDPMWRIKPEYKWLEDGNPAANSFEVDYRKSWITVDINQCETLEDLWEYVGHEVAHIVLAEFEVYANAAKKEGADTGALSSIRTHTLEQMTSQLERVFLRERPYPGDEEFAVK